jgi:enamine deaminase RidA (YjgF/YER057c/UK114 family)
MSLDETLEEVCKKLGLKVPPPPKPAGTYRPLVVSNGFAFVSGQLSRDAEGRLITGKVGREIQIEEGKRAAQWSALQALSVIKSEMSLERVEQIVRLVGYVQVGNDFYSHSEVMNGASELLAEVFGEKGKHARTSVGVASLPLNAAVEIELTLRVK